jgi:hypothetical protein
LLTWDRYSADNHSESHGAGRSYRPAALHCISLSSDGTSHMPGHRESVIRVGRCRISELRIRGWYVPLKRDEDLDERPGEGAKLSSGTGMAREDNDLKAMVTVGGLLTGRTLCFCGAFVEGRHRTAYLVALRGYTCGGLFLSHWIHPSLNSPFSLLRI